MDKITINLDALALFAASPQNARAIANARACKYPTAYRLMRYLAKIKCIEHVEGSTYRLSEWGKAVLATYVGD